MIGEDRELFERSLRHATATHSGAALDDSLVALGWRDAFVDDPRTAVSLLFELQGTANCTSSALDFVCAMALGIDAAVVLPAMSGSAPPGHRVGDKISVRGIGGAAVTDRDTLLVVTDRGAGLVTTSDLVLRPIGGIDPQLKLVEVTGDGVPAVWKSTPAWDDALAAGRRAIAHELVGASRAMLELARVHALERIQFGRPVASFQAVRHRLAESLVAIEAADAAAGAAWVDGSRLAAATAKAIAGRSARTLARHSQQVLAGIGFTTEHPLHRYVRRVLVLDHLLGDARALTVELGRQLLADGRLPPMVPL